MNSECCSIDSTVLQDYLDGRQSTTQRLLTECHIARCPEHRMLLAAYRRQSEMLHRLYDPILSEAIPRRLLEATRTETGRRIEDKFGLRLSRYQLARLVPVAVAVVVLLVVVSGYGGWRLHRTYALRPSPAVMRQAFVQQTVLAFALYGEKFQKSFRFTGDAFNQLASLFKDRFDAAIAAPRLNQLGYKFSAARVLPFAYGIAGQLVYRSGSKKRIAIYFEIMHNKSSAAAAAKVFPPHSTPQNPQFLHRADISGLYWYENNIAYAVIGNVEQHTLIQVARGMIVPRQSHASSNQGGKGTAKSGIKQT